MKITDLSAHRLDHMPDALLHFSEDMYGIIISYYFAVKVFVS